MQLSKSKDFIHFLSCSSGSILWDDVITAKKYIPLKNVKH